MYTAGSLKLLTRETDLSLEGVSGKAPLEGSTRSGAPRGQGSRLWGMDPGSGARPPSAPRVPSVSRHAASRFL